MKWQVPSGFELGKTWYSVDNGVSWTEEPNGVPLNPWPDGDVFMVVTKIDRKRGEITVSLATEGA